MTNRLNPQVLISTLKSSKQITRKLILYCVKSRASGIVVAARDTGVFIFILLLAHFEKMSCPKIWMKTGTSKKQKCIFIHTIAAHLDNSLLGSLPVFIP